MRGTGKKFRFTREGKESQYKGMVEHIREDGYSEVAVSIHQGRDCVADIYITIDPDSFQPIVYVTTNGGGNGDHNIIVRPLKDKQSAVEYE